jgi:hypothetical protein
VDPGADLLAADADAAARADLWGSRTRPLALNWASMRPARIR